MPSIFRRNARRLLSLHVHGGARTLLTTAIAAAPAFAALPVHGAPAGGVITAGAGSISHQGATTTITQSATEPRQPARMVIDWNSFSSAASESIVFRQPDASSIALNRVTGASPSQLLGSLSANGQVFILNPNGVLFGPGAQVNVRGLLASTLGMDNRSFLNGSHVLQGGSTAKVVNRGSLKAHEGGYVALVGPAVVNEGAVSATRGDALLAAGDKVTLRLEGGSLLGYSIDIGSVEALVDNTASGVIGASGGRIALEGRAADALSKAVVNHAGVIEAHTLQASEGSVRLIGDPEVGQLKVGGRVDASAPGGGNGGFVETSAAKVNIADGARITTMAPAGKTGTWLIDPLDFEIAAGSGGQTVSSVGAATLATALANANVTVGTSTGGAGRGQGDITVNADVAWGANRLTLQAYRNIVLNASLRGGSVSLLYGQASADGGTADYAFNNGAKIDLNVVGGIFTTQKGSNPANLKNYTIVRSLGAQGSADHSTLQGVAGALATQNYVLGADIDASPTSGWNGGAGFEPVGDLNGAFDGLGHTIKSLYINRPTSDVVGLFSSVKTNGAVRNLGITDVVVNGNATVGGLAGSSLGTIRNSYATGGVGGRLRVGGLVGINAGSISNSHSAAVVAGAEVVGGLVGEISAGAVSDSTASGAVSAAGPGPWGGSFSGGLVGFNQGAITGSYSSGSVSGTSFGAGGLVGGNTGQIQNSYAQGNVQGQSWVGGLVGSSDPGSTVRNAYATGGVRGADAGTTGGLLGVSAATVTHSYWNTDASGGTGQSRSAGGEGRTGAQLRQAATFGGWDIATAGGTGQVWRIYEGNSMPLLRSFLAPLVLDLSRGAKYSGTVQQNAAISSAGARTATAASGRNVGTYQPYSNQEGYDISNGELAITTRPLDITALIAGKEYDGTTAASATLADNRVAGDRLTTAHTLASFHDKNAGASKPATVSGITVSGADAGNYVHQAQAAGTASITPRPLEVVARVGDKVYDGTTEASATLSDNRIAGDALVSGYQRADFADRNAGLQKTVSVSGITLGGADASNYQANASATTTASITPKSLVITANPDVKPVDGIPYRGGNGATYEGFVRGDSAASMAGQLRFTGDSQGALQAGSYRITPTGLSSPNYASRFVDGVLTIKPAPAMPPGAGLITAYNKLALPLPGTGATRTTGADALRVVDCGIRIPENRLFDGC